MANPTNEVEASNLVDGALASARCAVQVCVHKTCGLSPGIIVFQRDMLLPIPVIVDL